MSWTERRLEEVTDNFDSVRVPVRASDRRPGPYPYYGASGVIDFVDSFLLDGEFLLVAEDGENLRTRKTPIAFVANGKFWVNNHAHVIRGNGQADTRFLSYYLSIADVSGYLSGSTQPKLTQASLSRMLVRLPSLAVQRKISRLLGALDDKIDLNRQIAETLDALTQSQFLYLIRRTDSSASVSRVGDELQTLLGGTPARSRSEYWRNGTVAWINSGKINEFRIVEPTTYITPTALASSSAKLLPARTTVVAITGATLGQVSLTELETSANQSVVGILGSESLPSEYIYLWFRNRIDDLVARRTGGAQQHINCGDVNDFEITVPARDELGSWLKIVRPLFDLIRARLVESCTLAELRDTLLPKLISGELCVRDAEAAVEGR